MAEATSISASKAGRNNGLIVLMCLSFVVAMGAMSYATVPLYRMFCQLTGFNGTTQRVEQASTVILDKPVEVSFDANVAPGLPWDFKPMQYAENKSDQPTRGQAIFNVSPIEAGAYFNKVQCFCFNETDLAPGEKREMPVVFYVDPDITKAPETKDITALTLSYTFYPRDGAKPVALSVDPTPITAKKL
jgi:cytochrome c oxidase assembly protein subunit 11